MRTTASALFSISMATTSTWMRLSAITGRWRLVRSVRTSCWWTAKVRMCRIESNRGGTLFAQNVEKRVKEMGGLTSITTNGRKPQGYPYSDKFCDCQRHGSCSKDESLYVKDREYRDAMGQLCSYSMMGRNKHDDVPDAIAMFVDWQMSDRSNSEDFEASVLNYWLT